MTYHQPVLRARNLRLDLSTRHVWVDEACVSLSDKEYLVLEYLMRHKGAVISKGKIVDYLYGASADRGTKAVDIFISRLRKKLDKAGAAPLIGTAWGRGFVITEPRDYDAP